MDVNVSQVCCSRFNQQIKFWHLALGLGLCREVVCRWFCIETMAFNLAREDLCRQTRFQSSTRKILRSFGQGDREEAMYFGRVCR